MSEQKQEHAAKTGVLVGIVTDNRDGSRAVAFSLTTERNSTTVILPNDVAVALFDSLGATLDSLGLLDDDVPGGVKCHH